MIPIADVNDKWSNASGNCALRTCHQSYIKKWSIQCRWNALHSELWRCKNTLHVSYYGEEFSSFSFFFLAQGWENTFKKWTLNLSKIIFDRIWWCALFLRMLFNIQVESFWKIEKLKEKILFFLLFMNLNVHSRLFSFLERYILFVRIPLWAKCRTKSLFSWGVLRSFILPSSVIIQVFYIFLCVFPQRAWLTGLWETDYKVCSHKKSTQL